MRVLSITHQGDAGPGVFAEAIAEFGASLQQWVPGRESPPGNALEFDAVVVCGGSMNPDEGDRHPWLGVEVRVLEELLAAGTPLVGLCLGGQLIARAAGAPVRRAAQPEIGWVPIEILAAGREDPVLGPLAPHFDAFSWHSYEFPTPPGAVELARSGLCTQACRVGQSAWGLQFHPEVTRADALGWIDDYRSDEDAVRIGIDPVALRAETEPRIDAFNQLGRDLCRRWLEFAADRV